MTGRVRDSSATRKQALFFLALLVVATGSVVAYVNSRAANKTTVGFGGNGIRRFRSRLPTCNQFAMVTR